MTDAEGGVVFQNDPVDISGEFRKQHNHLFVADRLERFDPERAEGALCWRRRALTQRVSYHQVTLELDDYAVWRDVPPEEYEDDQAFPLRLSFVSPRCVRVQIAARPAGLDDAPSPMLTRPAPAGERWRLGQHGDGWRYSSEHGSIAIARDPWSLELRDADGRLLTRTNHHTGSPSVVNTNPIPFAYVRASATMHRHVAVSLGLSPGERLYGCGESFTRLDKRGQKLPLWTRDAYSAQTPQMYKPVPFFLSNRGWAAFAHSSAPITFDLGHDYDGAAVIYLAAAVVDLFLFLGEPKQVISEYTALSGRARMPPAWSFGLWMGRDSYASQEETLKVARRLRAERIPCDVLHVDTEWPEQQYRVDFEFSRSRFPDPRRMVDELGQLGLRLSLWQLPYLHPKNPLHTEAIERGFAVLASNGEPPVDDLVIDLTNPEAVRWYQDKLAQLLELGVATFTSDFGEAAPLGGIYEGAPSGEGEHNLYPLRYAQAVAEAIERVTGEQVQMTRAAWSGSQRYPLHFSGDPETSDGGMLGTLRGLLSLGVCGFSFASHFVGGFPKPPPPDLYLRWLAFGALCSHLRCHGSPPREPWEFGDDFLDAFRRIVELRYSLLPYLLAQSRAAATAGHPLVRPLFLEHPDDPGSWHAETEYMLGGDLLVAPLFESGGERQLYLPPGRWHDLLGSERAVEGPGWRRLAVGEVPIVALAREGAAIPRVAPAPSTDELDWSALELHAYGDPAEALVALPEQAEPWRLRVQDGALVDDPASGRVAWRVLRA